MGKNEIFEVKFDKEAYRAGETLTGRVEANLTEPLKVTAVRVKLTASAIVSWQEGPSSDRRYYFKQEEYVKEHLVLKVPEDDSDIFTLPRGYNSFPFQFHLPSNTPPSFFHPTGHVAYLVHCTVDREWAPDLKAMGSFQFITDPQLDLNTIPEALKQSSAQTFKTFCCLCCASGPVSLLLMIYQQGFVPGDVIDIVAEVDNKSRRQMQKSSIALEMGLTFHAGSNASYDSVVITSEERGEIQPGESEVYRAEQLLVPQNTVLSSHLDGCKLIDVQYHVVLTVTPSGLSSKIRLPIKVTIGSIPARQS